MHDPHERIAVGGLMRCCIATIDERVTEYGNGREIDPIGTVLPCKYCKSSAILTESGWKWNEPEHEWNKPEMQP